MKALTLWQPWSTCIAYAPPEGEPKRIENRIWAPTRAQLAPGDLLAIHAGWKIDETAVDYLYMTDRLPLQEDGVTTRETVRGAVESVARFMGAVRPRAVARDQRDWVSQSDGDPRHVCWQLADVITLPEPVWCQGAQGLWTLPEDVEAAVREQMARAA